LARRVYAASFLEDCVLLYPVYALLFADAGLSPAAVSLLFVIWSATSVVVEVPSGVLADLVSRRWCLAAGAVLSAAGFAAWTFFPSFAVFAAGFVLWGVGSSLRSGAFEALVYEELARLGAGASYGRVIGRSGAVGTSAVLVATGVAAPVLEVGGYRALGVASVAVCLVNAAVVLSLPEHRTGAGTPVGTSAGGCGVICEVDGAPAAPEAGDADGDGEGGAGAFWRVLGEGWGQVRHERRVRGAVVVSVVLMGWTALDEYVPFLVAGTGAVGAAVPLLVLVVSAGDAAGGWLAGRGERWLGPWLAVAGVCVAVGALVRRPEGVVLVAVAFGVLRWAMAAADARLQERVADGARATVTSLAGLGSEVLSIGLFAGWAAGSVWAPPGVLFAVAALPCLVMAAALWRPQG
jgi:hypothetical protein